MNIAIIGATGNVGSVILEEAIRRGHTVTAVSRSAASAAARPGVTFQRGDVTDDAGLATLLRNHDAVISAVRFVGLPVPALLNAVKHAGVKRLLVVGGAGSLSLPSGTRLVDSPDFPAEYKTEALAGADCLAQLKNETELDWTFLSPSAFLAPGERTGKFRLGADQLLIDANGNSKISVPDFAVAMIDELERPQHSRQRFTVGY
jgi:uncharacterized protein